MNKQDRIRINNEIGHQKALASRSNPKKMSMTLDLEEHNKKMAELDKKFNAREKKLLASSKTTFHQQDEQ